MKTIVNIRAILVITAIAVVIAAICGSFFSGFATNKLISLVVSIGLLFCAFLVYPLFAKVSDEGITIVYAFGIYRTAKWTEIDKIVKSRGLFRELYFFPMKGAKKGGLKADFPASKKLEELIAKNWRGIMNK